MNLRSSTIATLVISLFVATVLTACPDDGPGQQPDADDGEDVETPAASPDIETHFTRPEPGEDDHRLEDLVIDLLGDVPADATVRAAYYTFSRTRAAEAFGEARDRGVDVELILDNENRHDDGEDWEAVNILRDRLGDALTICRDDQDSGGCQGPGIHHNKFITFSELGDGSEDVVLQSSANLTNPQLHQFNNTVVVRGDTALFDAYLEYWHDLQAQQIDLEYYWTADGDEATRAHFFPRDDGDTIVDLLDDVDCTAEATIHIGMAYFTDPRHAIAEKLAEMSETGCAVDVLVRRGHGRVGPLVYGTLLDSNVALTAYENDDEITIHSKYLLVDGRFRGDDHKIVWTGAHNYTGPALEDNDEVLLMIRDDATYDAFLDDWHRAAQTAPAVNH